MFRGNKRGNTFSNIILVGLLIFLGIIGFLYSNSAMKGDASRSAIEGIVADVVDVTAGFLSSTIGLLVGTEGLEPEMVFLRIIVFILISIIIVGSLDSINIFGDDTKSKWTNFFVGVIVSIIGIRYLPEDMWQAITAPSSAFVFAVMMGLPLIGLIFVIIKIRVEIIRKVIVAAYIIAIGAIFYQLDSEFYRTMSLIFLAVALLLLLFDAQFIAYVRKQSNKASLAKLGSRQVTLEVGELRRELKQAYKALASAEHSGDRNDAKEAISEIKQKIKDLSSDIS